MAESKLAWDKSGKKSSTEEIAAVSKKLGVTFPKDYVQYLESVNGGVPSLRMFAAKGAPYKISYFYELADLNRETLHFRSELDLPVKFVPIALAERDIVLLMDGKVLVWSMIESGFRQDRLTEVSELFDGFLKCLQAKIVKPRYDKFMDTIGTGDVVRIKKFIQDGLDVNGGGKDDGVKQAILVGEWKVLEVILEAGGSQTLPNGNSVRRHFTRKTRRTESCRRWVWSAE
ncbi:MAG: SMI1/KNR4 family protein [Planctomycetota bacterium]